MRINLISFVGIILIVLGIVAFTYRGIPYTSRENNIDAGYAGNTQKTVPMSPLLIGMVLVSGAALIAVGSKKSSS
jgi:hypothetical protein